MLKIGLCINSWIKVQFEYKETGTGKDRNVIVFVIYQSVSSLLFVVSGKKIV